MIRLRKIGISVVKLRKISSFNGVQLLQPKLREKLFRQAAADPNETKMREISDSLKRFGQIDVEAFNLRSKTKSSQSDWFVKLLADFPSLEGNSLDDHFRSIANAQIQPYLAALKDFCQSQVPSKPSEWRRSPGWTRYGSDFPNGASVEFPNESALVFDCEVSVKVGQNPIVAVALSPSAWYSWVSPVLFQTSLEASRLSLDLLIPMECGVKEDVNTDFPQIERIVVGHNVGYDRARLRDQYRLQASKLRFLDTMALHISVCGLASDQRTLYKAQKKSKMDTKAVADIMRFVGKPSVHGYGNEWKRETTSWKWVEVTSENSLAEVHQLHCAASLTEVKKEIRDIFVKGDLNDVKANFQEVMSYCSTDVSATSEVLRNLLPKFLDRFPHSVTLAGMLEMSITYLPVDDSWTAYIKRADEKFAEELQKLKKLLIDMATSSLNPKNKLNPWMWDVDWSLVKLSKKKTSVSKTKKREVSNKEEENLYPKWFKELCTSTSGETVAGEPTKVSPAMRITPKLLQLAWFCYPLHYDAENGWGYLVPGKKNLQDFRRGQTDGIYLMPDGEEQIEFPYGAIEAYVREAKMQFADAFESPKNVWQVVHGGRKPCRNVIIPGCNFYKLPHKNGPTKNVGTPFSQDYLQYIEEGKLNSNHSSLLLEIIKIKKSISYWNNNKDRIKDQMAVWHNGQENISGAILPQIVTAGTITRRAVEATWLTASNAYMDKVGSELKGMVRSPKGHKFVGADVDVQEMWIAAILGDSYLHKIHGSTPFSWRLYQGNKADGTDQHTVVANELEVTRDEAKILNFGRLYGGNRRFAAITLRKFNPLMSQTEAMAKADQLYQTTKGTHMFILNKDVVAKFAQGSDCFLDDFRIISDSDHWLVNESDLRKLSQFCELSIEDLSRGLKWYGGSESEVFNCLEAIASASQPVTPVLQCRISQALEPQLIGENFLPCRINWVVQSSAVDYLHLMLTSMRWLMTKYEITGRFAISIHDEVRYLVAEKDSHRAALALQLTNLLTRATFAHNLGFSDLPLSVAFFAKVDIDETIRKEVDLNCETPSNPGGISVNYGIPNGKSLSMEEILAVTGGTLDSSVDSITTVAVEKLSQVNSG